MLTTRGCAFTFADGCEVGSFRLHMAGIVRKERTCTAYGSVETRVSADAAGSQGISADENVTGDTGSRPGGECREGKGRGEEREAS